MRIYQKFCQETFDAQGRLTHISLHYPKDFNFGYDVVDALAETVPDMRALVWCNTENEEHFFSMGDISRLSNQAANVFIQAGIRRGDHVMVALKRHYEYWYVSVALHKIGAVMIPVTHMLTVEDLVYRIRSVQVSGIVCTPQNDVPQRILQAVQQAQLKCALWTVQKDVPGFANLTRAVATASM